MEQPLTTPEGLSTAPVVTSLAARRAARPLSGGRRDLERRGALPARPGRWRLAVGAALALAVTGAVVFAAVLLVLSSECGHWAFIWGHVC